MRWALPLAGLVLGCARGPEPVVRVTIPRRATLVAVADTLQARGVIRSPDIFRFYSRLTGRQRSIRAGTYDFPAGAGTRRALRILLYGRVAERRVVLPEGLTLAEVAELIRDQLGVPPDSFRAVARDSALLAEFGISAPSAEGYLYPSTYLVPVGATARDVVRQQLGEFRARWRPSWDLHLDSLGMSRHEAVVLASIIEGEVRYGPDRPYVSSVYHNRLRRGMRLQADPTVGYALGRRRRLFEKDYRFASPYNTYLIDGLPPGPIGQPSAESMEAALYPVKTDFLYLVARPDGKHVFSRTLREHLRATAEVRRMTPAPGPPPPESVSPPARRPPPRRSC